MFSVCLLQWCDRFQVWDMSLCFQKGLWRWRHSVTLKYWETLNLVIECHIPENLKASHWCANLKWCDTLKIQSLYGLVFAEVALCWRSALFLYSGPSVEAVCLSETLVRVHQTTLLGAFARSLKLTVTLVMSVCLSAWNNCAPTTYDVRVFFGNMSRKLMFN